jgi:hypothetical protein
MRLCRVKLPSPPSSAVSSQIESLFCFCLFVFPVFAFGFPCICFCFWLLQLYFYVLFFPIVSLRVFWFVCNSANLFRACFTALHSLPVPFFAPPPRRASNATFIVRAWLARDQLLFPCIFIVFLLVISHVSISLLLGVIFGPDL